MNKALSQYLDLLRVTAALLVLLAHVSNPVVTDGRIRVPNQLGYTSVMVFFVLSGYVISYVATERESALVDFAISRFARVYSVVLPALALTVFVDLLLMHLRPTFRARALLAGIPAYQYARFWKYIVLDVFFGNHLLGFHETAFSNGAFWSMCFEVYYYVLFAAAFYGKGISRVALLFLVVSVVGLGPMLRFPLWLMGTLVYWLHRRKCEISPTAARWVFAITAALMIADLATNLNLRIDSLLDYLTNSSVTHSAFRRLAGDTLTGIIIALNIFAARYAGIRFGRAGIWISYLASFSFSLYLMHTPLLRLVTAYWHPRPFLVVAAVLIAVFLLGQVTEKQKGNIRRALSRMARRGRGERDPARGDQPGAAEPRT